MTACAQCGSNTDPEIDVCPECGISRFNQPSSSDAHRYREQLLIERIAARTGIVTLARWLPYKGLYPPYLLVGLSVVIAFGILPVVSLVTVGSSSAVSDPITPATIALGVIVGVVGVRYMADGYATAVSTIGLEDRPSSPDIDAFSGVVSLRTGVLNRHTAAG